jgi:Uma2 family endonuclease
MPDMQAKSVTTAEHLLTLEDPGHRHELVRGDLRRMSPASFWHGAVALALGRLIANHVADHTLGIACGAETGFVLTRGPDTVLAPDVAFVRSERLPTDSGRGYFEGAPDLAVEVASPGDTYVKVHGKAMTWISFGCRLVWVVEPKARRVTIYRADGSAQVLGSEAVLSGEDVLPGLAVRVGDLFPASPAT